MYTAKYLFCLSLILVSSYAFASPVFQESAVKMYLKNVLCCDSLFSQENINIELPAAEISDTVPVPNENLIKIFITEANDIFIDADNLSVRKEVMGDETAIAGYHHSDSIAPYHLREHIKIDPTDFNRTLYLPLYKDGFIKLIEDLNDSYKKITGQEPKILVKCDKNSYASTFLILLNLLKESQINKFYPVYTLTDREKTVVFDIQAMLPEIDVLIDMGNVVIIDVSETAAITFTLGNSDGTTNTPEQVPLYMVTEKLKGLYDTNKDRFAIINFNEKLNFQAVLDVLNAVNSSPMKDRYTLEPGFLHPVHVEEENK